MNNKHLLFYDGKCGLCDKVVQLVLKQDIHKKFVFAPLQGQTSEKLLANLPPEQKNADSLVLFENYDTPNQKTYVLGQGAFRTAWLLGGPWKLLGWINFLPPVLYNWGYRIVAKNRHKIFSNNSCVIPDKNEQNRFLK